VGLTFSAVARMLRVKAYPSLDSHQPLLKQNQILHPFVHRVVSIGRRLVV
jgi:hypothetical protein